MSVGAALRNSQGEWRTGWRILAMLALLAIVVVGVNRGWRALGLPGRAETGPWLFLLFAALITGAAFGVVVLLLRLFEKRGPEAIGLPFVAGAWKETAAGTLLGAVPICLTMGVAVLAGYGTLVPGRMMAAALLPAVLPALVTVYCLAAWEELVLRGYLLRQVSIGINPGAAVVITAIVFGLLHSGNPGANWQGLLYTAIGGLLMGWIVIRSGSLWLIIGYHFGWNATASAVFGLELSGQDSGSSLLVGKLSGSEWLTGGDYGFEASLPTEICEVLVLSVALWLICLRRQSGPDKGHPPG